MPKTAALHAAVFSLSSKNRKGVFKHPPAGRGLNYFVVTLDQNTITTDKTNVSYEKGICNI